jgi:hypothetical protein
MENNTVTPTLIASRIPPELPKICNVSIDRPLSTSTQVSPLPLEPSNVQVTPSGPSGTDRFDKLFENLYRGLSEAKSGIFHLITTYGVDPTTMSRLEIAMEKIDMMLKHGLCRTSTPDTDIEGNTYNKAQ